MIVIIIGTHMRNTPPPPRRRREWRCCWWRFPLLLLLLMVVVVVVVKTWTIMMVLRLILEIPLHRYPLASLAGSQNRSTLLAGSDARRDGEHEAHQVCGRCHEDFEGLVDDGHG